MIRRSNSSHAIKTRTAWFPIVVDVDGSASSLEVHIGWKYYDGSLGLYSNAGKSSKSRPPWGCVIDCSLVTLQNKKNETGLYMKLQNRSYERKTFKLGEMNPALWEVNEFTSQIIALKNDGREKILSLMLSLLPKTKTDRID